MAYVYSVVGGAALLHLDPRIDPDLPNAYQTVDEMFETLFLAFGDQDKRGTALDDFRRLYQNDKKFTDFWADFLRLATILKMSDIDQQDELRRRISNDLKPIVATIFEATSVHDLAKKCTMIDNRL